ncbi:ATPase components of ABC transporters with duplicated ATPase domains [Evansella caseinilytica]|uniref:ATPase components of ABC transporters with duplicated ATPase domains n=1 Tax=Evansella caseinilytica TaxID=1503961 RepID=A0A1H3GV30_9BACI|nr:ATPase components of ABC transporters with duplicated ATPase domains [Evansella caseinilytica]
MLIQVNNIAKMYGGSQIFQHISMSISEREKIGFVGPNGCGKTTILKLLAGMEEPDEGMIHRKKGMTIGYLSQIPVFATGTTVDDVLRSAFAPLLKIHKRMSTIEKELETVRSEAESASLLLEYGDLQDAFTRNDGYELEAKINKVTAGLNLELAASQLFADLSGGEQTKVMLGKMLLQEPDFLLLDEPTNHLDIHAVEWLEQYLQEYAGTFLVVSHDRYFLDEVAEKIYHLEDGECHVYHGNYTFFVKEREGKLLKEFQDYQEQQKKIKKMKEAIKRLREWANRANPPNEGLHKRARNMERALERMEKLKRPVLERSRMGLTFDAAERSGTDVVRLAGVSKQFEDGRLLLRNIDFHLRWNEKAAIVGDNGTGKSTLLNIILGEENVTEGEITTGSQLKVGYLSQKTAFADKSLSVLAAFRNEIPVTEGRARHILAKFMFYGASVFRCVSNLSGGEQMRLQLAILMHKDVNFLVLDEPTNHLDIDSREVLEEALEQFNGTLLAVSHDRYFLNKLFTKTHWIWKKQLYDYPGNYSWARGKHEQLTAKQCGQAEVLRQPLVQNRNGNETAFSTPGSDSGKDTNKSIMKNNISFIEKEIEQLEATIAELEKTLAALTEKGHKAADDWSVIAERTKELSSKERQLVALYRQWEESIPSSGPFPS